MLRKRSNRYSLVARAGGRFGVVLDAHYGQRAMLQALHGVVVEVEVADLYLGRQAVRVNRVAVILGGDVDAAGWLSP